MATQLELFIETIADGELSTKDLQELRDSFARTPGYSDDMKRSIEEALDKHNLDVRKLWPSISDEEFYSFLQALHGFLFEGKPAPQIP